MSNGYAARMRRFAGLMIACLVAGCGGEDDGERVPVAKTKAKAAKTPQPPPDGVDTVAERVMEEVPGCTPDETAKLGSWRRAGAVAIRTGICEDAVLDAVTVFEFRSEKAAHANQEDYALIDDQGAKNGPVVASGKVRCHEESVGRKDLVNCMLRVRKYILLAHGRPGRDTDAVMNRRMAAIARAAE